MVVADREFEASDLSKLEQLLEERLECIEQKLDIVVRQLSSESESCPRAPQATHHDAANGQHVPRDHLPMVREHRRALARKQSGWGTSTRFGPSPGVVGPDDLSGDGARGTTPDGHVGGKESPPLVPRSHQHEQSCSSDPSPSPEQARLAKLNDSKAEAALPITVREDSDNPEQVESRASDASSKASAAYPPPMKNLSSATPGSLSTTLHGDTGRPVADRLWVFFEDPGSSLGAQVFSQAMNALIFLSVLVPVMETLPIATLPATVYFAISTVIDTIFLAELCIRWLVSPSPLRFPLRSNNTLDVAIIGPFVLRTVAFSLWSENGSAPNPEACGIAESILLCVVPILRLVKALRGQRNFTLLVYTLHAVLEPLIVPLNMLAILCVFFSCVLYVVEPRDNVLSMPHAMWLVIVTVSTVGYGDVSAVTDLGRVVTCLLIFVGCLCMAMPIGIVGTAFTETWRNRGRILIMKLIRDRLHQWGHTDEILRSLFSSFDTGNGELSFDQFSTLVQSMKLGLSEGHIKGVFSIIDTDHGGSIDFQEFVDAVDLGEGHPFYVF